MSLTTTPYLYAHQSSDINVRSRLERRHEWLDAVMARRDRWPESKQKRLSTQPK